MYNAQIEKVLKRQVPKITYYYEYLFCDLANFVNSVLKLKISLLKDIIINFHTKIRNPKLK